MPYFFRIYFTTLSIILFLYLETGCHVNSEIVPDYNHYRFDSLVIEKLPLYDSLALAILEKIQLFQAKINEKDSYRAYQYMPQSKEIEVFRKLPPGVGTKIDEYYTRLGKSFISGFDVFEDSTIKMYIRSTPSKTSQVDIQENLSYYPEGHNIRRKQFPDKDTILNKHWQYWVRFEKQSLF